MAERFPAGQANARAPEAFLAGPDRPVDEMPEGAERQVQLAMNAVKVRMETLGILVGDDMSAREVRERLKMNIRARMFVTYRLSTGERHFVMERLGQNR